MNLKGFFKKALEKTQAVIGAAFSSGVPEEMMAELEERLILADAGTEATDAILEELRKRKPRGAEEIRKTLQEILCARFAKNGAAVFAAAPPTVWFLLGTNGSGKTTTAAKLAAFYRAQGRSVALVAADTFRAAAVDQLRVWSERAGAEIFAMQEGAQPAAVIFDALSDKKIRSAGLVIVDTAGRLHTKTSLMEELAKMVKSCDKAAPGALTERLLVLDGTAGQNAVAQAKTFHSALHLTGFIVTKLDASAKAGFLLSMDRTLPGVPVKWIGMGEGLEDLMPFDGEAFVEGLIGNKTG